MPHDHRDLGREMNLFSGHPEIGPGLPLWHPDGAIVRHELETLARQVALSAGCTPVYSPVLAKRALFERSGHWEKFSADMFPPVSLGSEEYVLRPANCPHHAMIYASAPRTYRDLPVRLNELAPMFRAERSGVVTGLSRVRQITLDDTHVFARADQVRAEAARAVRSILDVAAVLGICVDHVRLSRRNAAGAYLGSADQWAMAEQQLRDVAGDVGLDRLGVALVEAPGQAAFYGPKLDVQVRDAAGREESLFTVQLDFNQPERFALSYLDKDGAHRHPVMIHCGVLGSMERMVAFLLELHDGRLPLWLAPRQVTVLPVSAAQAPLGDRLAERLLAAGVRAAAHAEGSLSSRIRSARARRDAVLAVVGAAEAALGSAQVTDPRSGFSGQVDGAALVNLLADAVRRRSLAVAWPG